MKTEFTNDLPYPYDIPQEVEELEPLGGLSLRIG
jgi:hypothetical protein